MTENIGENKEDISFTMKSRKLSDMFRYLSYINNETPITFYEDRIAIHQKSADNIQYTEIEIGKEDLIKYNPGLMHGNKYMNILVDIGRTALDEITDICNIVTRRYICGVREVHDVDIDVKVKLSDKRIEFHCPENVIIWATIIDDEQRVKSEFEKLCKMPEIINKVRTNPEIKKSLATMDHEMFSKIYCIENHDRYFTVKIDKTDGLTLVSITKDGFYKLTLNPKCSRIDCEEGNKECILIDKEYIDPFGILNGGPVTIEIRKDKPIILSTKLGEHTTVMLTAAPRIEEETDDVSTTENLDKRSKCSMVF